MEIPDLQMIARQYLLDHGYDGLYNADLECGCVVSDLMPCGNPSMECQAGYVCECPKGSEYDYMVGPSKREACESCGGGEDE